MIDALRTEKETRWIYMRERKQKWQSRLDSSSFPNMELLYYTQLRILYRQSRQHVLSGCWLVSGGTARSVETKRNVKRKRSGICRMFYRFTVVWPRLSSQSILAVPFNCLCVSVDPARSPSRRNSSRNNWPS